MKTLPLVRFLDTNGDGTGTKNAIGDYSGAGIEDFYLQPPAAQDFLVARLIVHISDAAIEEDEYGGLGVALTNGVRIKAVLDGTTYELDDGVAIKTNGQYGHLAYDVKHESWAATPTIESCHVRWTFARFMHDGAAPAGQPGGILLRGHRGDKLVVTLNDSFVGLVEHRFVAEGIKLLDWVSAVNQS